MANVINLPLLSDTMEEGIIADVFYKVGDKISGGDVIAEVETDKATMEVEAYDDHEGILLYVAGKGDAVPVGGVLAITGEEGEDISAALAGGSSEPADTASEETKEEQVVEAAAPVAAVTAARTVSSDSRVKASPLAKKMALDNSLNLSTIKGSGDEGRIIKRDIETALANGTASSAAPDAPAAASAPVFLAPVASGEEKSEQVAVSQMRKTIAKRLTESKFGMPHFYLTMELNMDKAIATRKQMNEVSLVKISFNDIVMKAAALALRKHPEVNSSWLGDKIQINSHVHVGMAVAVPDGLVVPVIRFADTLPMSHLAAKTKEMGGKAKNKELSMDEMQGQTFSISNLGMMGIEEFTAIINPPNAAIMAVGAITQKAGVVDGQIVPVNLMKVTLSCDHRVVDGAVGATFLQTFKTFVENPITMMV